MSIFNGKKLKDLFSSKEKKDNEKINVMPFLPYVDYNVLRVTNSIYDVALCAKISHGFKLDPHYSKQVQFIGKLMGYGHDSISAHSNIQVLLMFTSDASDLVNAIGGLKYMSIYVFSNPKYIVAGEEDDNPIKVQFVMVGTSIRALRYFFLNTYKNADNELFEVMRDIAYSYTDKVFFPDIIKLGILDETKFSYYPKFEQKQDIEDIPEEEQQDEDSLITWHKEPITFNNVTFVDYPGKSNYYTKEQVNSQISSIPKFAISVVTALPSSSISNTTVYLVRNTDSEDMYTEYIYVNGEWKTLGDRKVDLKDEADSKYIDESELIPVSKVVKAIMVNNYHKSTSLDVNIMGEIYEAIIKTDAIVFRIDKMSRAISQQINRHDFGITQASQRYIDSSDLQFIEPTQFNSKYDMRKEYKVSFGGQEFTFRSDELGEEIIKLYPQLIEQGMLKQDARSYLPMNVETSAYYTSTIQNLIHFINIREDKASQPEVQEIAHSIRFLLMKVLKNTDEKLAEYVEGKFTNPEVIDPSIISEDKIDG